LVEKIYTRRKLTPKVLYQYPKCAGKSFQPSNGTEGRIFMEAFCDQCIHENAREEKYCDIIAKTMAFRPGDKEYPSEWVYNQEGWPVCTAWVKWDWDNDGDPDDLDNPNVPIPVAPNQLNLFPLYPDETHFDRVTREENERVQA
jgi:hypothetical protein